MKKERREDSFIKQPYYVGGDSAMKDFISKNIVYPESSRKNNIDGHINLKYDINYKGDVTDVKIIAGLDEACNEESIRVVKLLKFKVPKTPRHLKITFHKSLVIHFNQKENITIESEPETIPDPNQGLNYQYNIVYNPKSESVKPSLKFTYTVKV